MTMMQHALYKNNLWKVFIKNIHLYKSNMSNTKIHEHLPAKRDYL